MVSGALVGGLAVGVAVGLVWAGWLVGRELRRRARVRRDREWYREAPKGLPKAD